MVQGGGLPSAQGRLGSGLGVRGPLVPQPVSAMSDSRAVVSRIRDRNCRDCAVVVAVISATTRAGPSSMTKAV